MSLTVVIVASSFLSGSLSMAPIHFQSFENRYQWGLKSLKRGFTENDVVMHMDLSSTCVIRSNIGEMRMWSIEIVDLIESTNAVCSISASSVSRVSIST